MELMKRVLKDVREEFDKKGVNFTMDEPGSEIGISKRTIYEQVGKKEEIIRIIIEEAFQSIKNQEKQILSDDSLDITEKIKRVIIIMSSLSGVLDYRRILEIQKYYPELYQIIERHLMNDWEAAFILLDEGIGKKRIKNINKSVFKEIMYSAMEHMLRDKFLTRSGITYDQALREMIGIVFDGILVKGI